MNAKWILCGLAALVMTASGAANAYDGGISESTLSAMGLGGATIVSDQAAAEVRGHGFAIAAGGSFAFVGSHKAAAGSANGYFAKGHHYASGKNGSYAGKTVKEIKITKGGGMPPHGPARVRNGGGPGPRPSVSIKIKSIKVYAGGYSSAASY